MVRKEAMYKGKSIEELQALDLADFALLTTSRIRRCLKRGLPEEHKILLERVRRKEKDIKTHCRDMVIVPLMVNTLLRVHSGKEYMPVEITLEMLGHRLGEFVVTRRKVSHNAPGIGATRSSASMSVK